MKYSWHSTFMTSKCMNVECHVSSSVNTRMSIRMSIMVLGASIFGLRMPNTFKWAFVPASNQRCYWWNMEVPLFSAQAQVIFSWASLCSASDHLHLSWRLISGWSQADSKMTLCAQLNLCHNTQASAGSQLFFSAETNFDIRMISMPWVRVSLHWSPCVISWMVIILSLLFACLQLIFSWEAASWCELFFPDQLFQGTLKLSTGWPLLVRSISLVIFSLF